MYCVDCGKRCAAHRNRCNRCYNKYMEALKQETTQIVASGKCPHCGSKLKRNLSLSGWWQCEQYGSEQFRARPQDPACSWQGFV